MGLSELVLVDPIEMPNGQAQALSRRCNRCIEKCASGCQHLEEAISDCGLVVGTSARSRTLPWPMLDPRGCGEKLITEGKNIP